MIIYQNNIKKYKNFLNTYKNFKLYLLKGPIITNQFIVSVVFFFILFYFY